MTTDMLDADDESEREEGSFLKRNWIALVVAGLVLGGGTFAAIKLSSKGGAGTRKTQEVVVMQVLPPPVVLPPPPPPPPQAMDDEMKAEDEAPKEDTPADAAPSTGVAGNGPPDNFGLAGKGGAGRRISAPRSTVSTWAPYANSAASRIADAMRRHNKLKGATMAVKVRIWIDATGRISKAVVPSTGNAAADSALQNEVLAGMQLSGPPPEGMKMPVNLMVTARRP